VFSASESFTNSNGAPAGHSGSVGDASQTCNSCHTPSTSEDLEPSVYITSGIDYYVPGQIYYIAVSATEASTNEFGFQACVENDEGEKVGELILLQPSQTKLISNGDYITHTSSGTTGFGEKSWMFSWKAPMQLHGDITLHVSTLFSNNNGGNSGDHVIYSSETYAEPILGCMNPEALNYDSEHTVDDGSCFFSVASSGALSLNYDSLSVSTTTDQSELIVEFDVYNTSDEPVEVFVSRNVLTPNTPLNWFCWNVCYLHTVDVSPLGVVIQPDSYTNSFSAHLAVGDMGGEYDIEYCFYTEGENADSLCVVVSFNVEGDIYGCTDPNALNFDVNANTDDGSCILYPQPSWYFSDTSNVSHSIVITTDAVIQMNDEPISEGDWIGVFYEDEFGLVCAGYTEWQNQNVNLNVYGIGLPGDEGFLEGEEFIWQVWDASNGISWPMEVVYSDNLPNQASFMQDGLSAIVSMSSSNPITEQLIEFPEGWSIFSSYMITQDMNIVSVLEPIVDNLIIAKDNNGLAYIVEYDFNALGDIEPGQGYLLKTTEECSITVSGAYAKPDIHPIDLDNGWNIVGYLLDSPKNAELVFDDLVSQDVIMIVKDYMGQAYIPEWYFNGIGDMEPGQGYQVKTSSEAVLQY
jgi:hypothetical protein